MHGRVRQVGFILSLVILSPILIMGSTATGQPSPSQWKDVTGALMSAAEQPQVSRKSWYIPGCEPQMAVVEDYGMRAERDVCVVSSGNIQLGVYRQSANGATLYALQRNSGGAFHRVTNLTVNPSSLVLLPDSTILGASQVDSDALAMYSLASLHERLVEIPIATGPSTYNTVYDVDTQDIIKFVDSAGRTFPVRAIAVSNNKKFAVAQSHGRGVVRVNLETRAVKQISDDTAGQLATVLGISDDGKQAVVTGDVHAPHRIYTELDECGSDEVGMDFTTRNRCYGVSFAINIEPQLFDAVVYEVKVSGDREFVVYTWSEATGRSRMLSFTPDPSSYRLDYLALGDSYSSGEGDIERKRDGSSYYLPGTGLDKDDCHIGSRSYPFLLRDKWEVADSKMKSVACSGAMVVSDYFSPPNTYPGQNNRLKNHKDLSAARDAALKQFTPGHVPQLEFVKKYQPKLITFTGGGNDIGFKRILEYCAGAYWQDFTPIINLFSDCGYVHEGSELQRLLYDSIDSQYYYNKRFITEVQRVSPTTKIVTIGYPSFITEQSSTGCVPNSGLLTRAEIQMLNKMVDYMNSMLQRLAHDTSTHYVNITDSLKGGRICEGSKYMTGTWPAISGDAQAAERFHPNAEGHKQIAKTIEQADIRSLDAIPGPGLYELAKDFITSVMSYLIELGKVHKDEMARLQAKSGTLGPHSKYSVTVYSDPVDLGTFTAGSDGSIDQEVSFKGIPAGQHVLVVKGVDELGDPIRLYQFIEVEVLRPAANKQHSHNNGEHQSRAVSSFVQSSTASEESASELMAGLNVTDAGNTQAQAAQVSTMEQKQGNDGYLFWLAAGMSIVIGVLVKVVYGVNKTRD